MKNFRLKIITQEEVLLETEVESLYVTTIDGDINVLPHHTPYVSVLKPSEVIIKKDGKEESFACTGGILEVTPEKVVILADSAVRTDQIDEEEALKVKERAESIMAEKLENRENAEAMLALEKALLHLRVAQKRKRHIPHSSEMK
ncbi:MAG: ATP synthase F1 subunit epsilon [Candidatus Parcubacteria bacterium]|nr:ATP synthase F1 subunit epsilon [Candidatus Parcubacteria bacterium]